MQDPELINWPLSIGSPFSARLFISQRTAFNGLSNTFFVFPVSTIVSFINKLNSKLLRSTSLILIKFSSRIQNSEAPLVDITFKAPISDNGFLNLKSTISTEQNKPSNK